VKTRRNQERQGGDNQQQRNAVKAEPRPVPPFFTVDTPGEDLVRFSECAFQAFGARWMPAMRRREDVSTGKHRVFQAKLVRPATNGHQADAADETAAEQRESTGS